MLQCNQCNQQIETKTSTNIRQFDGGTLYVTDVSVQKCDCDEQILLGDGALIAGYARFLSDRKIIGNVTVSFTELKLKFVIEDFFQTNAEQYDTI
ncbi:MULTISPECIES: hypothetical protein [unclassified Paenibacillus]|uniref:hypothetical protein n=1 Tax=unclassified Paenibacillus TaxID=185978 RepID=UPI00278898E5|nr:MULTISPECIES: hypothetical protein [unclassified Paenibacillus]MDQ0896329.1 hypothetical protein [Paenibacillus sp. V4I7]MDQ0913745.1 hypothetical protein [Paenibacillus sp. V4I5]